MKEESVDATRTKKKGDLDDAQEITDVWTYFMDNQVEQLFNFVNELGKRDNLFIYLFFFVKILFWLISSHLF